MQNAKNLSKILKSICLNSIHISIAIAVILAIIQDTLHENKMSQKCVQCT